LINQEELKLHINNVRKRREHAHVWDSQTFSDFMLKTLDLLQLQVVSLLALETIISLNIFQFGKKLLNNYN
jgi:hypothetical protein